MLKGNGTSISPYIIENIEHLRNIGNNLSAHYKLNKDIVLDGEFVPIGSQFEPFTGVFDGNNCTIYGLCIKTGTQYIGLFSYNTGVIKNLNVKEADILGTAYVGTIVGYNNGKIESCSSDGTIVGTTYLGGLVGYNDYNGYVTGTSNCKVKGTAYCGEIYGCNKKDNQNSTITEAGNEGISLFVSEAGNDMNDGSKERPFKTIHSARDMARKLINQNVQSDITIYIREGKYYLDDSITLTEKDCFNNGFKVSYKNYENESVKIIGGKPIKQWQEHLNGVKKAYVGQDWCFKKLYVNSISAIPANTKGKDLFEIQDFDVKNVYAYYSHGWFSEMLKVIEIDKEQKTLKTGIKKSEFSYEPGYLFGAVEFIKEKGDWAIGSDGYVYYYPSENQDMNKVEIIAPTVKSIFIIKGKNNTNVVQDIEIEGLQFEITDMGDNFRAHGGVEKNSFEVEDNMHAAIYLENVKNIVIRNNIIKNCAVNGISLNLDCRNNIICSNIIENIGFAGIHCNGNWINTKEYINKHNYIHNNKLSSLGNSVVHGAGVYLLQSGHNHLCNNLIYDTSRYGISLKGVRYGAWYENGLNMNNEISFDEHWDYLHSRNNLIEGNKIHDTGKNSLDGGGIEAWGPGRDNVIDYNLVYNYYNGIPTVKWKGHGIFLDDSTHYFTVTNNIVYESKKQGSDASVFMKSIGTYVRNNIFDVTNTHQGAANIAPYIEPCKDQTFINNIIYADPKGGIGEDGLFIENGNLDRRIYTYEVSSEVTNYDNPMAYLDKNIYYNTKGRLFVAKSNNSPSSDVVWDDFIKETGFDSNSINQDPLFEDVVNRNYSLKTDSPAFKIGFKNIDMGRMGIQKN